MSEESVQTVPAPPDKLRVAVEGCGHGTLHAIYSSVTESCRSKGWGGVDLVIVGGDFQAVRNAHDLNVTAMPPKYRRMADFHEYYSGHRTAPYLTIFIGGNHEASNHLFELYYGGWVAPNIYYLGAANVIDVGPLRIAGLSGIWKGYDYRKPHFERLPYSQQDMTTIFHVRELDVRKLSALREQVDIGLSHDWPEGIVWHGNHRWLFKKKDLFEADAKEGKLGSIAARDVMERLRPPYWFSAHLHCKYAAAINYEPEEQQEQESIEEPVQSKPVEPEKTNGYRPARRREDQTRVSAWQSFHESAEKTEADEREQILKEQEQPQQTNTPKYTFQETFKKVTADENLNRTQASVQESEWSPTADATPIPQVDGCAFSAPRKRRREGTDSPQGKGSVRTDQTDGLASSSNLDSNQVVQNPDAIEIDMSDDEDDQPAAANKLATSMPISDQTVANPDAIDVDMSDEEDDNSKEHSERLPTQQQSLPMPASVSSIVLPLTNGHSIKQNSDSIDRSEDSQDGGVKLNPAAASFHPPPLTSMPVAQSAVQPTESLDETQTSQQPASDNIGQSSANAVSSELAAELASLSHSFRPSIPIETSPALPFPTAITNKTTSFLALDKCEPHRDFLQLLEIPFYTSPNTTIKRPVKLNYDQTWLAITRVFASELELGGEPSDKVPTHRGDTWYNDRIIEEEKWVQENIVEKDLLTIPENFEVTAPVHDPDFRVDSMDMPIEYTNPQTNAFCELVGIENKFDISEEARAERRERGPRSDEEWNNNRSRGGHRGGKGGRSGRGGGRGRRGGRRGRW